MEKYFHSRMCKTKSKLLCILDVKKNRGHQTTIYINPPNPPHCSIFVAHLTSEWKSLIDLRFHASTSTVSPLDCTLVHTWPHPGTSTWRWHLVSGGCGTCVWHLLVELACGTCLCAKTVALGTITTWLWHLVAGLCSTGGRVGACSCRQEPSCRQTAAPLPGGGAGHHLHHQLIHQTSLAANGQWQKCHCTAGGAP